MRALRVPLLEIKLSRLVSYSKNLRKMFRKKLLSSQFAIYSACTRLKSSAMQMKNGVSALPLRGSAKWICSAARTRCAHILLCANFRVCSLLATPRAGDDTKAIRQVTERSHLFARTYPTLAFNSSEHLLNRERAQSSAAAA